MVLATRSVGRLRHDTLPCQQRHGISLDACYQGRGPGSRGSLLVRSQLVSFTRRSSECRGLKFGAAMAPKVRSAATRGIVTTAHSPRKSRVLLAVPRLGSASVAVTTLSYTAHFFLWPHVTIFLPLKQVRKKVGKKGKKATKRVQEKAQSGVTVTAFVA